MALKVVEQIAAFYQFGDQAVDGFGKFSFRRLIGNPSERFV
jgi:hypothetical protein